MTTYNLANNFYQILINNCNTAPNKKIIFEEDLKITNQQLVNYVNTIASYLYENEIKPGDKVAMLMSNSWQFVASLFAINKIGAVVVPINNFLKEDEIAYILNDSHTRLLIASGKFAPEVRELIFKSEINQILWVNDVPLENDKNKDFMQIINNPKDSAPQLAAKPDALAFIVYTSGTTGKPKGAMLSFNNISSNIKSCMECLRVKPGKIPMVCYLPMFHAFTLTVTVLLPILTNSGVVIIRSIATKGDFAKLLKHVLLKRVPYFAGVPDVFSALAKAKLPWYFHWFHSVKGFISGAAPLAEETIRKFNASFKRGTLLQGYGISECSPVVSVNVPWDNKIGSVGKALPGYEVECFDENMQQVARGTIGEICVKGDCVMMGYYNRAHETQDAIINDWFRTGDVGKVDSEGFIFIVDRKKDLIIHKGMNIYPREIEEVIYTNDKVNACAVIGVKDSEANEIPVAYIELKENEIATEAEIKEYIRPHLAVFKQPRKVCFVDKLPRNATGKILKRELRDTAEQEQQGL